MASEKCGKFGLGSSFYHCWYKGCTSIQIHGNKRGHTFHTFPKNEDLCKEWLVRGDREDLLCKPFSQVRRHKLCSLHFDNSQYKNFMRKHLIPNAMPSVFAEVACGHSEKTTSFSGLTTLHRNGLKYYSRRPNSKALDPDDKNNPNVPPKSLHLDDEMSNGEQSSDLSGVNLHLIGRNGNPSSETLQDRGCSTEPGSPCKHFIELIEEKARNHKLRRANEAFELQVEELVNRIQELQTSPPSPSLAQGEFAGHCIDVKEESDVEVKEEELG